ncbi:nascent polypeptide-associated complex subunit alpha-like protein 2 [Tanacetum coccineum]
MSASKSITRQYDDVLPDGNDKSGGKQSRSEKKSHKAMFKLGMKAILGVSRVTIERTKNIGSMHNLLLDRNTLMVPPVVAHNGKSVSLKATEDFIHLNVKFTWFSDGHISYEDSEVIMKPGTEWGKILFSFSSGGFIILFNCSNSSSQHFVPILDYFP